MTIDIDAWHREIRAEVVDETLEESYRWDCDVGWTEMVNNEVARRLAARVVEECAQVCDQHAVESEQLVGGYARGCEAEASSLAIEIRALNKKIQENKNG